MNPGDLIGGKYRLVRQIGEGAMGVVWSAVNELTTREVALKLMLRPRDDLRHRLLREARACGGLSHRHIVEVYDVGQTDSGDPFLVMQLLSGETLAELLARQRRLEPQMAVQIGREVAKALEAAHAATIIHRDLKPANIFLHHEAGTDGTVVKVLDFGVSKNLSAADDMSTAGGGLLGSPAYMSPEQIRVDRTLDHRTDIWSFGVILFEMLTGVRPFKGTGQELIQNILTAEIPPVSKLVRFIDPALVGLIARCLERDRDERIGSAADVAQALQSRATAESSVDLAAHRVSAGSSPNFSVSAPPAHLHRPSAEPPALAHQPASMSSPRSQEEMSPLPIADAGRSGARGSFPAIAQAMAPPPAPTEKLPPALGAPWMPMPQPDASAGVPPATPIQASPAGADFRAPERAGDSGEYATSGTLKLFGPAMEATGAAVQERLSGSTTSTAAVVQSSSPSVAAQQGAAPSVASPDGTRRGRAGWVVAGISALAVVAGGLYVLLRPSASPPAAVEATGTPPEAAAVPAAQPGPSAGAIPDGSQLAGGSPAASSDPAIASASPSNAPLHGRAPLDNGFYEDIDGDVTYGGLDRKSPSGDGVYDGLDRKLPPASAPTVTGKPRILVPPRQVPPAGAKKDNCKKGTKDCKYKPSGI
jgi:serine/threonine-protein kinase